MPAEEGIGRDQGVQVTEYPSPEALGLCGPASALGVGEPETARTELLSADAILFLERVNDVTRLLVDPAHAGQTGGDCGSDWNNAPSIPAVAVGGADRTVMGRSCGRPLSGHGPSGQRATE